MAQEILLIILKWVIPTALSALVAWIVSKKKSYDSKKDSYREEVKNELLQMEEKINELQSKINELEGKVKVDEAQTKKIKTIDELCKIYTESLKSLLRSEIVMLHSRYTEKGVCPIYIKDQVNAMYQLYSRLGGNGMIPRMVLELNDMPVPKE